MCVIVAVVWLAASMPVDCLALARQDLFRPNTPDLVWGFVFTAVRP